MPVKTVTLKLFADTAEGQRKLDDIFAKAEELGRLNPEIKPKIDKAAVTAGLAVLRAEMKAAARQSDDLSGSFARAGSSAGAMAGPSGMGALIGAGVALSPVIATLGIGLAGVGAAAFGVLSPIMKAAQASGGLQANMAKLDPEQKTVAKSLLGLGKEYDAFQASLQPEVIGAVNAALKVGGNIMRDVQPVAAATGQAFNSFLGQFGRTLQDPEFRQFWQFMATTAPGDMKLLGKTLTDVAKDVPAAMQALQPFAQAMLAATDATANLVHLGEHPHSNSILGELESPNGFFGRGTFPLTQAMKNAGLSAELMATGFGHSALQANAMGIKILAAATDVQALMAKQDAALNVQLGYGSSLITTANDAASLRDALKKSHDVIGLHTQAQRDSFAVAQTFIGDLRDQANQAITSGHGIDAATRALRNHLPELEHAKSGTRQYWQEVQLLIGKLRELQRIPAIKELIKITGTGNWSATAGELPGQPGKHFVGRVGATGGRVPGYGGGDRHPYLLEGGEAIVPKHLTPAVAPFLKAQGVPGFAAGGIIPSYAGNVPGLQAWGSHNFATTQAQVANSIGNWLARSFASAVNSAAAASGGGPGVARWLPDVLQALAMLHLPSTDAGLVLRQMASESGGNPMAINLTDINAAMGDPSRGLMQVIGSTFARWRSFSLPDNIYDPMANIFAALNYAEHGRGIGTGPGQLGSGHAYDHGGYLPPGLSLAYNGTGKPEPVGAARGGNTYHVHIHALVADKQTGARVVEAIKKFESGSGKGWRS